MLPSSSQLGGWLFLIDKMEDATTGQKLNGNYFVLVRSEDNTKLGRCVTFTNTQITNDDDPFCAQACPTPYSPSDAANRSN